MSFADPSIAAHCRTPRSLRPALAASLLLHALVLLPSLPTAPPPVQTPPLAARLNPSPASLPLRLDPPEPASRAQSMPPPRPSAPAAKNKARPPDGWRTEVRRHFRQLDQQGLFYPAQAIAHNEQGDVQVLIVLSESGKVRAARVEASSGHPLLDQAALHAVRSLSTLPDDAPRELVLPVRFRLR